MKWTWSGSTPCARCSRKKPQVRRRLSTPVLNLAARAGVRQSIEDPWAYFETNVTGTLNLLELCKDFGVMKFVLASTSSAYGAEAPMPFREDAATDKPLSPYAASKKRPRRSATPTTTCSEST